MAIQYSIDADGNVQADIEHRASYNFVQGALQAGADVEQIKEGLQFYGRAIARMDGAPGTLDHETIDARVSNNIKSGLAGEEVPFTADTIRVTGVRDKTSPSGKEIITSTVAGGLELLDKATEF